MPTITNPITRRYVADRRMLLVLGRAFALQAGHPIVAAGIAEHSTFKDDPWARLRNSLSALMASVYAPSPEQTAANIRYLHRRITGTDANGRRYHALHPEPYFWVLATTLESVVVMAEQFARPMTQTELNAFYEEWRELGRLLGLRDLDMPTDWHAFQRYYADMLRERVENNNEVQAVLDILAHPPSPWAERARRAAWAALGTSIGHVLSLTTNGTLPPDVRARWGIRWTRAQTLELAVIRSAVKRADLVPPFGRRLANPTQPWQPEPGPHPTSAPQRPMRSSSAEAPMSKTSDSDTTAVRPT